MQILFQVNVDRSNAHDVLEHAIQTKELKSEEHAFVYDRVISTVNRRKEIDKLLAGLSENWNVSRIGKVERAVLHLALTELISDLPDNEPAMVVNEAVRLAKKFGGDDSGRFVNGLLGAWLRNQAAQTDSSVTREAPDHG